jgi:hypothetical protein
MRYDRRTINLAAGEMLRVDAPVNPVHEVVVQCHTGVLDMWVGDFAAAGSNPDWRFRPGWPPEKVPMQERGRFALTLAGVKERTTGTIVLVT